MKQNIKQILREGLILEQRIKFDLAIPSDIQEIKDVFKQNGFKLYVVGGAVRDALLGKTPKDYDKNFYHNLLNFYQFHNIYYHGSKILRLCLFRPKKNG
jgi:hypothetical protein